mgnify:CR=1 FL=1
MICIAIPPNKLANFNVKLNLHFQTMFLVRKLLRSETHQSDETNLLPTSATLYGLNFISPYPSFSKHFINMGKSTNHTCCIIKHALVRLRPDRGSRQIVTSRTGFTASPFSVISNIRFYTLL